MIWLAITLLYQLKLSGLQGDLSNETYLALILIITTFAIGCFIGKSVEFSFCDPKNRTDNNCNDSTSIARSVNNYFVIWLVGSISEVIILRGVPLLWLLFGDGRVYTDFGIPTLHGFLNALSLVIMTYNFIRIIDHADEIDTHILWIQNIIILFYFIMIMNRQVIICALIQFTLIYIIITKHIKIKVVISTITLIIIMFGIVGNVRTGYENFYSVSAMNPVHPALSGFQWAYMYSTMTLSNINSLLSMNIEAAGIAPILNSFLPSIVINAVGSFQSIQIPYYLVSNNYTVSGYFVEFYLAYHYAGVAAVSFLYGLLGGICFRRCEKKSSVENIILYSITLQIIMLSFFTNMLLYLPNVFQLIIVIYLFRKRKSYLIELLNYSNYVRKPDNAK